MKVTVTEWDGRPEVAETQWAALAKHVASEGSDFVLLPEFAFSAWLPAEKPPANAQDHSLAWNDAVIAHKEGLAARADGLGVPIALTAPAIARDGRRVNRGGWHLSGCGFQAIHDKYHLPEEPGFWEEAWYDRGDEQFRPGRFEIGATPARKISMSAGFMICSELWFFNHARSYAAHATDLILSPRATGAGSLDRWLAGGRCAAIVGGAYNLSSNRTHLGETGPDLGGMGWVIDPDGEVLATTSADTPYVTVEIDVMQARAAKTTYPRYVK
ncbi:MAG: carbon-nitrogen hydrolase family protein [Pseudomonadota bacterium]